MHGYLETLQMKEQDFDSATRSEYLATALQHSRRITKLVDELFELAKLDAREMQPKREPFALAELVQDVIQKFQLPAEERQDLNRTGPAGIDRQPGTGADQNPMG